MRSGKSDENLKVVKIVFSHSLVKHIFDYSLSIFGCSKNKNLPTLPNNNSASEELITEGR